MCVLVAALWTAKKPPWSQDLTEFWFLEFAPRETANGCAGTAASCHEILQRLSKRRVEKHPKCYDHAPKTMRIWDVCCRTCSFTALKTVRMMMLTVLAPWSAQEEQDSGRFVNGWGSTCKIWIPMVYSKSRSWSSWTRSLLFSTMAKLTVKSSTTSTASSFETWHRKLKFERNWPQKNMKHVWSAFGFWTLGQTMSNLLILTHSHPSHLKNEGCFKRGFASGHKGGENTLFWLMFFCILAFDMYLSRFWQWKVHIVCHSPPGYFFVFKAGSFSPGDCRTHDRFFPAKAKTWMLGVGRCLSQHFRSTWWRPGNSAEDECVCESIYHLWNYIWNDFCTEPLRCFWTTMLISQPRKW